MFIVLKTDYFQLWLLFKNKSDFSTAGKHIKIAVNRSLTSLHGGIIEITFNLMKRIP